ncbi:MAG TPA: thioredoxin-dependent thiol peroxidase [Chitinophagaceae bacterium]|jgi:peroxiredoxin Q/BCP|nr:thioredoxin-dependent thiol peroxidase [Chitinophagaceae bacterium]
MATHLQVGDKAPNFSGTDQNGRKVSLKDYKGRKLVVYFYPENDTPACTVQACNLRDNFSFLKSEGYEIVGISPNDAESHKAFIAKFELPFPLIPDPKRKIIEQFGVWGEKNLYGRKYLGLIRTSFVIDESGKIIKIFRKPRTKSHAEEIVK